MDSFVSCTAAQSGTVHFATERKEPSGRVIDLAETPAIPLILTGRQIGMVKLEEWLYPVRHPSQCHIGQPVFCIAAAYIRVRPGKPDLLEPLGRKRTRQFAPQCRYEVFAMLVECQRMKGVLNVRSEVGILKLIEFGEYVTEVARYAQRANRVPYPNAFYWRGWMTIWEMNPNVWLLSASSQPVPFPKQREKCPCRPCGSDQPIQ